MKLAKLIFPRRFDRGILIPADTWVEVRPHYHSFLEVHGYIVTCGQAKAFISLQSAKMLLEFLDETSEAS